MKFKIGDVIVICGGDYGPHNLDHSTATIIDISPNERILKVTWLDNKTTCDLSIDDDIFLLKELEPYTKPIKFDI